MEIKFTIKETLGIKDYICKYYSASFFGYLRNAKAIIICNQEKVSLNDIVLKDSQIVINYKPIKQEGNPSSLPIRIIYEDEDCLVVDKESGVVTIPSRLHQNDTVFNRLQYYYRNSETTLHFINRLDKDTSGLILICKNQYSACLFNKYADQFIKEYQAETHHPLPQDEGFIELPIKRINGMKRWVVDDGKPAKTQYKLMNKENGVYTYLVRLHTGLTHQIRVHFAYHNSPLINDPIYSEEKVQGKMHLHACYLKFYHPLKDKWIELNSIPNFFNY